MKDFLVVITTTYNEAPMVPWFLRYYGGIAERIIVYDDKSTDGTRELLEKQEGVQVHDWEGDNGIDEDHRLAWAYKVKAAMVNQCHWLMIVDFDEFIFSSYKDPLDVRVTLADEERRGTDVIQTGGFNMMHRESADAGIPDINAYHKDVQLWHLIPYGVYAPVYSKPVVLRPEAPIDWHRGRHQLNQCPVKLSMKPRLKLLHYRYLSPGYTKARNARNYARCNFRTGDKGAAWTCDPKRNSPQQEGSSLWTKRAQSACFNVIETAI